MISIAAFGFGLIVGSFLNVVIARMATDESLTGRSHCPTCRTQLVWYELIPVLSWIALRGKCRSCAKSISFQYPLVELATAVGFLILAQTPLTFPLLLIAWTLYALCIAILVFDLYYTLIPDAWSYPLAALSLVYGYLTLSGTYSIPLILVAGPLAALPLFGLWAASRGAWMGFGDVKLALALGWILGPILGVSAVFFGFVIGAVVSVGILLPLPYLVSFAQKMGIRLGNSASPFTMKSEVPFGPFLIASLFILWYATLFEIYIPFLMFV